GELWSAILGRIHTMPREGRFVRGTKSMTQKAQIAFCAICAFCVLLLGSRSNAEAQAAGPVVRRISTASAVSTQHLGSITSVRELPHGRLLLNDGARRRLVLMDTTLKTLGVVLDSIAEIEKNYGTRPAPIIPDLTHSPLLIHP